MTERQLGRVFDELHRKAEEMYGPLPVVLAIGPASQFPKPRNYAYCTNPAYGQQLGVGHGCCMIAVAPKILAADPPRVLGLLMHELGHAVDFLVTPDHRPTRLIDRQDLRARIAPKPAQLELFG